jgi:cold shock protein
MIIRFRKPRETRGKRVNVRADEGWGVIDAPEVPGGCFVHFSSIEMPGYRQLHAGQHVRFTFERPGFLQDDCPYRANAVWPDT